MHAKHYEKHISSWDECQYYSRISCIIVIFHKDGAFRPGSWVSIINKSTSQLWSLSQFLWIIQITWESKRRKTFSALYTISWQKLLKRRERYLQRNTSFLQRLSTKLENIAPTPRIICNSHSIWDKMNTWLEIKSFKRKDFKRKVL